MEDAIQHMTDTLGIPVVVASGNSAKDSCGVAPARVPTAITVAASNLPTKFGRTRAGGLGQSDCRHYKTALAAWVEVTGQTACAIRHSVLCCSVGATDWELMWSAACLTSGDTENLYSWSNTGACVKLFA
jgi:hypothetical protein